MENIIKGNSQDELKNIEDESVDLILTDPPYGIDYHDGISKKPLDKIKNDDHCSKIDWENILKESYRVLKPGKCMYICGRTDFFLNLSKFVLNSDFRYIQDFLWLKGDMGYGNLKIMGSTHELLLVLSKGAPEKSRMIEINGKKKKRTPATYIGKLSKKENYGHPTQKPIGLMSYIILNRTDEGDTILDPFAGSGSTLIASHILNRNSIGIEIDENFINLMNRRLNDKEHLKIYQNIKEKNLKSFFSGVGFELNS